MAGGVASDRFVLGAVVAVLAVSSCGSSGLPESAGQQSTTPQTAQPAAVEPVSTESSVPSSTEPVATAEVASTTAAPPSTSPKEAGCAPIAESSGVRTFGSVVAGPWPRPEPTDQPIGRVPSEVAVDTFHLGFDLEGDPGPVIPILDVLDRHAVRTTFFVQGQWAEAHPGLLQEIVERGHELANHAHGGERLGEASADRIVDELTRTENIVAETTGATTQPYFRPPNGNMTDFSIGVAANAGYTTIRWSGGANDFVSDATVESMCAELLEGTVSGAILLAHTFNPQIPETLDRYLREVHRARLIVVPLSVLFAEDPTDFVVREREDTPS